MLVDTDILIDYLRGHDAASDFLEENIGNVFISSVTVAELFQGVREGKERKALTSILSAMTILPLGAEIAEKAGLYRRDFRNKTGCGLADCMIAATAQHHALPLATLNGRHFSMVKEIIEPYRKD